MELLSKACFINGLLTLFACFSDEVLFSAVRKASLNVQKKRKINFKHLFERLLTSFLHEATFSSYIKYFTLLYL